MYTKNFNIFTRIKNYRELSKKIQDVLTNSPDDAPKFQEVFNLTVDRIYQDILEFEKDNIEKFEPEVYKFKKIFEKRYRNDFLFGEYIKWCSEKPFGYSGDFKIIDDIYRNQVRSKGFDSLWDNWFQQLAACKSVRARKEDFKRNIIDFVSSRSDKNMRFMSLACGPAREIKELLETDKKALFSNITFDCCDFDIRALNYAGQLLNNFQNVNFLQKNAIRLALKKKIEDEIPNKYDLVYCAGLFDYLDERVAVRLVSNLKKILRQDGIMLISNARDKYSNASAIWMEWIGGWFLTYRTEGEFREIFLKGGFSSRDIQIIPQKDKVMQYCIAKA